MSLIPSSNVPLAYLGTNATTPPNIIKSTRAPLPGDFRGYRIGDEWIDTTSKNAYILVSLADNMATWNLAAASTGDLSTLTGNSGGPVSPSGANINLVGDGTTVNVVGNPSTNTLTISATGGMSNSFPTDSGTATPSAGVLNINGDPNITTTGSSNTVHVDLNQAVVVTSFSTATPTPISNSLLISGNTIQAAGTATNVGINITAKGTGAITTSTQNTEIISNQNTITFDTTAAASSGSITFDSNGSVLSFNGQSNIVYTLLPQGSGTGTIGSTLISSSVNTTDNTPTTLTGSEVITAGELSTIECIVQGTSTTTGSDSTFARVWASAAYYTAAGSAVLIGTPVIDLNTTNLSTAVTASVVANTLVIQVTGITGQTWEWTAQMTQYISRIV